MGSGEPELAAGFLLQGRSGERRRRVLAALLLLDVQHAQGGGVLDHGFRGGGRSLIPEAEFGELLAVELRQPRGQLLRLAVVQRGDHVPVFDRHEGFDLGFTFRNQPQRDGLHPAGGAGARQLAPQDGGEVEADQIVQRTPGHVGVDQILIDHAGVLEGIFDGRLGDLVEDHALDVLALELSALLQLIHDVPGDCFAFTVGVGRKDQLVVILERLLDVLEPLVAVGFDQPGHLEILVRIDRAILGRQITDVSETCKNFEIRTEVLVDGFGL